MYKNAIVMVMMSAILYLGLGVIKAQQKAPQYLPHIDTIVPNVGFPEGNDPVTITGTMLMDAKEVRFDGILGTYFQKHGPTQVTCRTPAHPIGTAQVWVVDEEGNESNKLPFTYRR